MRPSHLFIILLSVLLCSCSQNKELTYDSLDTENIDTLNFRSLNSTFSFGYASKILLHDSVLIVYDEMQNERIQFFNKESGCFSGCFGRIGQGDKELISPANLSINGKSGVLSLYDYARGILLSCRLTDLPNENPDAWFSIDLPDYDLRPNYVTGVSDNEFIAMHGSPRFTKACGSEVLSSFDSYPVLPDNYGEEITRMFFLSQSIWDISPDGQKMVQATTLGSILQIFDLKTAAIKSSAIRYFHKPIFAEQKGQIEMLPETIFGFSCIQATDRYIYATLHGVANPTVFPDSIYVFDWNGNLIKKLSTDQQICCFCVDEQNCKIYAMVMNEAGEQILGYFIE